MYRVFRSCYAGSSPVRRGPARSGGGPGRPVTGDYATQVAAREDMGSWLGGGPSGEGTTDPRAGLGLPATGPGSPARLGRRVGALAVDWLLCLAVSAGFFGGDPMATLGVFALENVLLVGTAGYTVGHRLLGLRVRSYVRPGAGADGVRGAAPAPAGAAPLPGPGRAAVRTVLLCLVIPAVVWDDQGRSLHDRAAGTVIVRG